MIEQLGPYKINSINIGDTYELIDNLPAGSVDLLVTDPPYFLPVQSYVGTREGGYNRRTLADMSIMQTYFNVIFEKLSTSKSRGRRIPPLVNVISLRRTLFSLPCSICVVR